MAKTRRSERVSKGSGVGTSSRSSRQGIGKRKYEEVSDVGSDSIQSSNQSEDSFVVGDDVIIPDSPSGSEEESDDDVLNQHAGLRSSQVKIKKEPRPSSRSRQKRKKKRRRIKSGSSSNGGTDEEPKEGGQDSGEKSDDEEGMFKCYNPSCAKRVKTPKDLKHFCTRCAWWEHPFYLSVNDCKKDGNMNCFFCLQLKRCRGCKSIRYQNLEPMNPIVLKKGEKPVDYPDPNQTEWKFYWNKFIRTSKCKFNIKLGDCLRIKEKKGKFNYLIRVNYLFVDGKNEVWVMGYRILDFHSKEISIISTEDFEVDNRNFKKVFPTQKFLTGEISYYSLDQFEVIEVVCCVWYKQYYGTVRGFREGNIFPYCFNYYFEEREIEIIEIPDWRVCEYELIEKKEKDVKSIGVSTHDIVFEPLPVMQNNNSGGASETRMEQVQSNQVNPVPSTSSTGIRIKQEPMGDDPVQHCEKVTPQPDVETSPAPEAEPVVTNETDAAAYDSGEIEWPDEQEEEQRAQERLARQLLKTCMLSRTPLVIHPDIDLQEPSEEIKVSWMFPL